MNITLKLEFYEALVYLARLGSTPGVQATKLEQMLAKIDSDNGITRHQLAVIWTDATAKLPPGTRFPTTWPPTMRTTYERTDRAITKQDILDMIAQRCLNPVDVMVTLDMTGQVGWTKIDDYFRS